MGLRRAEAVYCENPREMLEYLHYLLMICVKMIGYELSLGIYEVSC